jgi:hypothetical protein
MDRNKGTTGITRRRVIKTALGAAAAIGAPAIIGRAPITSARADFAGESLIVVSWSGNHELSFRANVVEPFNAKYGTKVETVGGWDQMVSQIVAAPADNPPFDITIADEYTSSAGLAEKLFLKTDRSKIPGFSAVYPWFDDERGPDKGIRRALRRRLALDADQQVFRHQARQLAQFLGRQGPGQDHDGCLGLLLGSLHPRHPLRPQARHQ